MSLSLPALYPIVNIGSDAASETDAKIRLALRLAEAGARLIQLRAKNLTAGVLGDLTERLVTALAGRDCQLIVNDRADVAAATGAAGVHLGDEDLPAQAARKLLGSSAIIGFSTHSLADVENVPPGIVDYIGFGPVFESPTKAGLRDARGLEMLRRVCEVSRLPVVAIGGVSSGTAEGIFAAGAESCAVISELERSEDSGGLVTAYEYARRRGTATV